MCGPHAALQGERQQLMAQLAELEERVAGQKAEVAQYAENDPERFEAMSECAGGLKAACLASGWG